MRKKGALRHANKKPLDWNQPTNQTTPESKKQIKAFTILQDEGLILNSG
jgi:hypothetical protein